MNANILWARTTDPAGLLKAIKTAIDKGHVRTWKYDTDGDFTHCVQQWEGKAWLRPTIGIGALGLSFRVPKTGEEPEVRGVYLGRFSEMLINHFRSSVASLDLP